MMSIPTPVDELLVADDGRGPYAPKPIFGGYTNASGRISLFTLDLAYRIDLKKRLIQQKPLLNPGAQAMYDATQPGEEFQYGGASFRRLSNAEIAEICASGAFRLGLRAI